MLSIVCKSDWRAVVGHLHELFFQLIYSDFIPHCFVLYINAEYFGVNLFQSWCDSGHFSVLLSDERTDWIFLVVVLRFWTVVLILLASDIFLLTIFTLVFLRAGLDMFGKDKMGLNEIHKVDLDDKFTNLSIVAIDMLKVIFKFLKLSSIIKISKLYYHIIEPDDKILNCYCKSILNLLKRRKPNWHVDFYPLNRIIGWKWKVNGRSTKKVINCRLSSSMTLMAEFSYWVCFNRMRFFLLNRRTKDCFK